jgi:hypothetical protein
VRHPLLVLTYDCAIQRSVPFSAVRRCAALRGISTIQERLHAGFSPDDRARIALSFLYASSGHGAKSRWELQVGCCPPALRSCPSAPCLSLADRAFEDSCPLKSGLKHPQGRALRRLHVSFPWP